MKCIYGKLARSINYEKTILCSRLIYSNKHMLINRSSILSPQSHRFLSNDLKI